MHVEWHILTQIYIKTIVIIYNNILCPETLDSSKQTSKWETNGQNPHLE